MKKSLMQKSQSSTSSATEGAKFNLNFPRFWPLDPQIWFEQVEAYFQIIGITDDDQKYRLLLANADQKLLLYTADIVRNPSLRGDYTALKARIVQVFFKPLNRQLEELLEMHKTEKPSKIIKAMKIFAGDRCDDAQLTSLFLSKCIPELQQALTIGSDEDPNRLQINADKMSETRGIFEQDQNVSKLYTLNQIRDLLRSISDRLD